MSQLAFAYPHNAQMSRQDFFVSSANSAAIQWIERWPDWPGGVLIVQGPKGAGKTHLLELWKEKSGALDLDLHAVPEGNAHYALDDSDTKCTAREAQEQLFHWLNHQKAQSTSLMIATTKPLGEWPSILPDLMSRLRAASYTDIHTPDDALLEALLEKLFRDRQLQIDDAVLKYLSKRIERSFDIAHDVVAKLDEISLQQKRRITVDLAREIL